MSLLGETPRYDRYLEYLETDTWAQKRNAAIIRDHHKCSICKSPFDLRVHHLRFPDFGNEPLSDLMTLCEDCLNKLEDYMLGHTPGKIVKWDEVPLPAKEWYIECEGEKETEHIAEFLNNEWKRGGFEEGGFIINSNRVNLIDLDSGKQIPLEFRISDEALKWVRELCELEFEKVIKEGKDE